MGRERVSAGRWSDSAARKSLCRLVPAHSGIYRTGCSNLHRTPLWDAVQAIVWTEEDSWRGVSCVGKSMMRMPPRTGGGWSCRIVWHCASGAGGCAGVDGWSPEEAGFVVARMWLGVFTEQQAVGSAFQLGAGLGYPVGPILVRDTIFP